MTGIQADWQKTVVIVLTQAKARGEKKKRRKTGESQRGVKVGGEMEAVR